MIFFQALIAYSTVYVTISVDFFFLVCMSTVVLFFLFDLVGSYLVIVREINHWLEYL